MWKLSRFEVLCKLFGIILVVHSTNVTLCSVYSRHVLIILHSFLIIIIIWFMYLYNICLQSCIILAVLITLLFSLPDRLNILSSLPPPHDTKCYQVSKFLFKKTMPNTKTILPPPILSVHYMEPRMNIVRFTDNSYCMEN